MGKSDRIIRGKGCVNPDTELMKSLSIFVTDSMSMALSFPKLKQVNGKIWLKFAKKLTSFKANSLESTGNQLRFHVSDELTTVSLDSLKIVGGQLYMKGNPVLVNISIKSLESVNITMP